MDFKGKLFVFSAPSGSGKSTIVNHLLSIDELNLAFSISATSRAPRGEEKDGEHYYFMSADEFKSHIEKDDFLEWEEVYQNNFYGTLKSEVERIWKMGKHVVFDIDVIGGLNIKKQFPEQTLSIFIMPPSVEELRNRLVKRSTETAEKIEMRVAKAAKELESASSFDVVITNDELDKALVEAEQTVANFIQS
ncbi:MAG: guanylate kinase [Flavobacteriaceae bacterium]|jgi:guanylate kinase|nr:guanylate kinase [Flavobacteriaceae bacterium]NVJ72521.1 guanylate kinase [Flavobacteriaceae bacterium]